MRTVMWVGVLALGLVLVACGGGGGDGDGTITLQGRVIDLQVVGAAGIPVEVLGHPVVMSGAGGAFTVPGVEPPYVAIVGDPDAAGAVVYDGLTRSDPTLLFPDEVERPFTGRIEFFLGGGQYPQASDHVTRLSFRTSEGTMDYDPQLLGAHSGTFDTMNLAWPENPETVLTARALQYLPDAGTGVPNHFDGFGVYQRLFDGFFLKQSFDLSPVDPSVVQLSAAPPQGYTVSDQSAFLIFGVGDLMDLPDPSTPPGPYVAPDVAGTSLAINLTAEHMSGADMQLMRVAASGDTTPLAFMFPAPTLALGPADGTVGVGPGTPFQASALPNQSYLFRFLPAAAGPTVYVVTTSPVVNLGAVADYGLPFPAAAGYEWAVSGVGPTPGGVDDLAGPWGVDRVEDGAYFTLDDTRTFFTAP